MRFFGEGRGCLVRGEARRGGSRSRSVGMEREGGWGCVLCGSRRLGVLPFDVDGCELFFYRFEGVGSIGGGFGNASAVKEWVSFRI